MKPWEAHSQKQTCPAGHPYAGENLILQNKTRNGNPWRKCRECSRIHRRAYVARWFR